MNWRADLQKIRNNREKADNAAKRAEEKAKKLAQRQEEAENMGILYVVRSMPADTGGAGRFSGGQAAAGQRET